MTPQLVWQREADDALELQLRWTDAPGASGGGFLGRLVSARGEVALVFGPSADVERWPPFVYRYAVFGRDGALLRLRLDPGTDMVDRPEELRALDLGGRSERASLLSMLAELAPVLARLPQDDPRVVQTQAVLKGLPKAFASSRRASQAAHPAANAELFAPSVLGCEVDEVHDGRDWRHVRLAYLMPRLGGFWTDACTWRLFQAERTLGLEFRDLEGDVAPPTLLAAGERDEFGMVLRVGMLLEAPCRALPPSRRLSERNRQLATVLARQTARDLPNLVAAMGTKAPFATARWRHWLRLMPDILARDPSLSLP